MVDVTQQLNTLLSHAALTNAATAAGLSVVGSEVDVRGFFSATVYVYHALIEAAANDPGVQYKLQARFSTGSGVNEDWVDVWTFTTGTIAGVKADISGTEASGETTLAVDADPTAAFAPGALCYVRDTGTLTDSEWARVAISATAADIVTIVDGLTTGKDSADEIWNGAETFVGHVDLSGVSWLRMIVSASDTTGADIHFKAEMVSFTVLE